MANCQLETYDSNLVPRSLLLPIYNPVNPDPQEIRWKKRFQNPQAAFAQLSKGLAIETPRDIEKQGIIQSFQGE